MGPTVSRRFRILLGAQNLTTVNCRFRIMQGVHTCNQMNVHKAYALRGFRRAAMLEGLEVSPAGRGGAERTRPRKVPHGGLFPRSISKTATYTTVPKGSPADQSVAAVELRGPYVNSPRVGPRRRLGRQPRVVVAKVKF